MRVWGAHDATPEARPPLPGRTARPPRGPAHKGAFNRPSPLAGQKGLLTCFLVREKKE